ncbi:MAG: HlyD family efflux transporter periplasmic adaptor subunit [Gemmatimonadetes bacterium]|nr:HlyD family efflux transporter periplasmic adaptor subunit [Gemmatimonadota bacterium]
MALLLIVGGLSALPLVTVDVYVSAAGVIRPTSEKHALTVAVDGVVEFASLEPAATVERDQVVLRIRARSTEAQQETLAADLAHTKRAIGDLTYLLSRSGGWLAGKDRFETIAHLQQARELEARLDGIDVRIDAGRRELERLEVQLEGEIVTPVEVEVKQYELRRIHAQRALLLEEARSRWADALSSAQAQARQLGAQRAQLAQTRALHEVRSPVRGSLEEVVSLSPGSFVRAGTRLAVVSPDTDLVAEVWVPPSDMGFIRLGLPVLMRVHAFNPQEWGVLTGRVESIGGDVVDAGAGPVFRVRASIDRSFLELPTGHRGNLRKGMTFEARFLVARRSLFQLLRDRVHDWILSPVTAD